MKKIKSAVIVPLMILSGCASTHVQFPTLSSSKAAAPATRWQSDIDYTNTYFAYGVKIRAVNENQFECDKKTAFPFTDNEEMYGLILSHNDHSNQPVPVILFNKNGVGCGISSTDKLITPYKRMDFSNYTVQKLYFSSKNLTIHYKKLLDFVSGVSQLTSAFGSGSAKSLVYLLDNQDNRKAYESATSAFNDAIKTWLENNQYVLTTMPDPILSVIYDQERGSSTVETKNLDIGIQVGEKDKMKEIGKVTVYAQFLRSKWVPETFLSQERYPTFAMVQDVPLYKTVRNIKNDGLSTATYGDFLDQYRSTQVEQGTLSVANLQTIGDQINWDRLSSQDESAINSNFQRLQSVCQKVKGALDNEKFHEIDLQLFLANYLENSPLWNHRIKNFPVSSDVSEHELRYMRLMQIVDLSGCLNLSIQKEKIKNNILTTEEIVVWLKQYYARRVEQSGQYLVDVFEKEIASNLIKTEYKYSYVKRLKRINGYFSPPRDLVRFQDNRDSPNPDWESGDVNVEQVLEHLWDLGIQRTGCYLNPLYTGSVQDRNPNGIQIFFVDGKKPRVIKFIKSNNMNAFSDIVIEDVRVNNRDWSFVTSYFSETSDCRKTLLPYMQSLLRVTQ